MEVGQGEHTHFYEWVSVHLPNTTANTSSTDSAWRLVCRLCGVCPSHSST